MNWIDLETLKIKGFNNMLKQMKHLIPKPTPAPQQQNQSPKFFHIPPYATQWKAIYDEKDIIISMQQSQLQSQFSHLQAEIIYEQMLKQNLQIHLYNLQQSISILNSKIGQQNDRKMKMMENIDTIQSSMLLNKQGKEYSEMCLNVLNK